MGEETMIFITVGSQKFQFNRLLEAMDILIGEGKIAEEVFAQTGYSDYIPQNYEFEKFLDREEYSKAIQSADIVITHGGTGAIIEAVKKGKKVIAVPRRKQFGEHVDDHQLQLVDQFKERDLICECLDCSQIDKKIVSVMSKNFMKYTSSTNKIIESVEKFIELA